MGFTLCFGPTDQIKVFSDSLKKIIYSVNNDASQHAGGCYVTEDW